jgi:predicted transcriptional regulator
VLWQRWQEIEQEIEELDNDDKELLAELNAIEDRIIDQPAKARPICWPN